MENTAIEAEAFAELVRKMAGNIVVNLNAGHNKEALDVALSLMGAALDRKREFRHALDMENPDRFDLSALAVDPNAPNDEADGLAYD